MAKGKPKEMEQAFDMELFGEKYPGTPRQRLSLLNDLRKLVEDYREEWCKFHKNCLLAEVQLLVNGGDSWMDL